MIRVWLDTKVIPDNEIQSYNCRGCGKQHLRGIVYNIYVMRDSFNGNAVFFTFCGQECAIKNMIYIDIDLTSPYEVLDPLNIHQPSIEERLKNE